jgi:hypothetical protein
LISGNVRLSPDLVVTLRLSMAPCLVLEQLDPAMIPTWIDALMSAVGPEATVVSLWLDPRPAVSALAKPELLTRVVIKADDREAAWRQFVSMGSCSRWGWKWGRLSRLRLYPKQCQRRVPGIRWISRSIGSG